MLVFWKEALTVQGHLVALKVLIHKQFWLQGCGGLFEPHNYSQTCTTSMYWLRHDKAGRLMRVIMPFVTRELPPPVTPGPFLRLSKWQVLIGWPTHSPIWNTACCVWNAWVETDALSRFKWIAMLTHDLSEIRFRHSSSPVWLKWLRLHQPLKLKG